MEEPRYPDLLRSAFLAAGAVVLCAVLVFFATDLLPRLPEILLGQAAVEPLHQQLTQFTSAERKYVLAVKVDRPGSRFQQAKQGPADSGLAAT